MPVFVIAADRDLYSGLIRLHEEGLNRRACRQLRAEDSILAVTPPVVGVTHTRELAPRRRCIQYSSGGERAHHAGEPHVGIEAGGIPGTNG